MFREHVGPLCGAEGAWPPVEGSRLPANCKSGGTTQLRHRGSFVSTPEAFATQESRILCKLTAAATDGLQSLGCAALLKACGRVTYCLWLLES